MPVDVFVERAAPGDATPTDEQFLAWVAAAAPDSGGDSEVGIRVVGAEESRELNERYRAKNKPTNVLSFPSDLPAELLMELEANPLGDLVICAPLVDSEAAERNIATIDHWAHLVVHGVLHLRGYDHAEPGEAEQMEALEVSILAGLGIDDPYVDRRDAPPGPSRQG